MKKKVYKLDIGKLETAPVGLSKLTDVVKNDVVKKTDYDELVKKARVIDTRGLVKKQIIRPRSKILKIKYLILLA